MTEPQTPEEERAPARVWESLQDPLTRKLAYASAVVLLLWLLSFAAAMIIGVLRPAVPRTSTERALMVYEGQVNSGEADLRVWAAYIRALIGAKQYSDAESAIERALASAPEERSTILVERARLSFSRGDYAQAVEVCDETLAAVEAELRERESVTPASQLPTESVLPEAYGPALLIKADSLRELGDAQRALETYDTYLERWPTAADVLVRRGDIKALIGDESGAEDDYRKALSFGDYEPAKEGLERIGADPR